MKVYLTIVLLICMEQRTKTLAQPGVPISPCPKIFQYRYDGSEWFGLIAVRNTEAQAQQLRVTLSMRGKPTTNYLGEIELLTRGQFARDAHVLYKIRFPKHHFPPKLLLISVNNQVLCFGASDQSIFMTQIQLEHTRKLTFLPDHQKTFGVLAPAGVGGAESTMAVGKELPAMHEFDMKPLPHIQFKKKPFKPRREQCGRLDKSLDFRLPPRADDELRFHDDAQSPVFAPMDDYDIDEEVELETDELLDGVNDSNNSTAGALLPSITRGAWPWLAAIYVNNLTSLDYQCGGTLVSARVVISSAHCFQLFNQRYTANEVLVFLGRYNLKNWNEEGSLAAPVDGIYIHADYNKQLSNYDADIAVVVLKTAVRFNTFIQPVCLWSGSSKMEYIIGDHGIVIGWSFNRSNASSTSTAGATVDTGAADSAVASTPLLLKAPIVSNERCFGAQPHFRSLASNRTFCAGVLQQRGASRGIYTGISGAGLMILRNNRWMLRGTVSAALPAEGDAYILYADVAKFIDWIMAFIL
ncbi:serine protease gd isoform X2 [Drosophila busckii]|nr:serine protease gd isoform X2 [Drosophila busckii]